MYISLAGLAAAAAAPLASDTELSLQRIWFECKEKIHAEAFIVLQIT
jgi:hypothetical protein